MEQDDKRPSIGIDAAISGAGLGIPPMLWVLGELKVHPPKLVLYFLLVVSGLMIAGPWAILVVRRIKRLKVRPKGVEKGTKTSQRRRVASSTFDPARVLRLPAQPPSTLAERLATLYHESKQLQMSLSIGRIAVLARTISGTSEPTQIELERRVRAWDMQVDVLLSTADRPRWAQSATLPAYHPTRALIEPSTSMDGLIRFVEKKRACLKEIIERMGDHK